MGIIIFFIIGIIFGYIFNIIGYRLPINIKLFKRPFCDSCNTNLSFKENIPIFSFIKQKGKCNYCHQRISIIYIMFELLAGLLFSLTYLTFINNNFCYLYILVGLIFISTMLIIMFSDIKYMLIPDELLIISSILVIIFKLLIDFKEEEISSLLDIGYQIIFMLIDGFIMFLIMYVIKRIGDIIFKKESLGGGDVKMMVFVSIFLGYKLSIIVIFIASFIALPFSIYKAYKKSEVMLPFGPYLAIASIILFLCNIDFNMILDFIH